MRFSFSLKRFILQITLKKDVQRKVAYDKKIYIKFLAKQYILRKQFKCTNFVQTKSSHRLKENIIRLAIIFFFLFISIYNTEIIKKKNRCNVWLKMFSLLINKNIFEIMKFFIPNCPCFQSTQLIYKSTL